MMMTGVRMVHVPYRSVAAAMTDMLSGHVHISVYGRKQRTFWKTTLF
jgi:tripartite-type tricarboxylate transporter receptor subunit TctC